MNISESNDRSGASPDSADAELKLIAKEAAEALEEEWTLGEASRFCDDPPDWDYAETDEIAAKLLPFFIRAKHSE